MEDWPVEEILVSSPDLGKYCQVMEEVKRRIAVVRHFLDGPQHALYRAAAIESMCLQIRKILELIALGSLVTNQDVWERSLKELRRAWSPNEIFKELSTINPDFFPQPVVETSMTGPVSVEIDNRSEGFLTKEKLVEIHGRLGGILHARNPMGPSVDYDYWMDVIPQWMTLIINLLNSHLVRVLGNPNLFLIHMRKKPNGNVGGTIFEPVGPASTPSPLTREPDDLNDHQTPV